MKIAFYGNSLTKGTLGVSYIDKIKSIFPHYEIINFGKNGDTVKSLYERIKRKEIDISSDISFLWIGTNDVFKKVSRFYPVHRLFSKQVCSENHSEFSYYYKEILYILSSKAKKVVCVPPIFIGEDLKSGWNMELKDLSEIISDISNSFDNVTYFNLRDIFELNLKSKTSSDYIVKSSIRVLFDYFLYNTTKKKNKKSKERGLFFTIDGAHLNEKGADIVSSYFCKIINDMINP